MVHTLSALVVRVAVVMVDLEIQILDYPAQQTQAPEVAALERILHLAAMVALES
jgi:hypothetical protein